LERKSIFDGSGEPADDDPPKTIFSLFFPSSIITPTLNIKSCDANKKIANTIIGGNGHDENNADIDDIDIDAEDDAEDDEDDDAGVDFHG